MAKQINEEWTQPLPREIPKKLKWWERIPPIWGFGYTPYYILGIVVLFYVMRKK